MLIQNFVWDAIVDVVADSPFEFAVATPLVVGACCTSQSSYSRCGFVV